MVRKVCQGHRIFRDESHWAALSPATGSRGEKRGQKQEEQTEGETATSTWWLTTGSVGTRLLDGDNYFNTILLKHQEDYAMFKKHKAESLTISIKSS